MATAGYPCYEKWITFPLELPPQVSAYALDIGGSLAKLAYAIRGEEKSQATKGTRIRMVTFKSDQLQEILQFIKDNVLNGSPNDMEVIGVGTGIGVLTSQKRIKEELGSSFQIGQDEFTCVAKALHYGLTEIPRDDFILMPHGEPDWLKEAREEGGELIGHTDKMFPALVDCIGSAMSIQMVSADGSAKLVGGSIRGGLYTQSVGKLLTQCKDFVELRELASRGNWANLTVTMQEVLQITYGDMDCTNLQKYPFEIELFPFGKIIQQGINSPSREDVAAAWLRTSQTDYIEIATLQANVYRRDIVYFCGSTVADDEAFNENSIRMVYHNKFLPIDQVTVYPAIIKPGRYMTVLGALLFGIEDWLKNAQEQPEDGSQNL